MTRPRGADCHGASLAVALSMAVALCTPASAHDLGQSASRLDVRGAVVVDRLTIDLLEFPAVDVNRDGKISYDELDRTIGDVFTSLKAHLAVTNGGQPATSVTLERHEIVDDHVGRLEVRYQFAQPGTRLDVTSTLDQILRSDHQHAVSMLVDGQPRGAVLDATRRGVSIDVGTATAPSLPWAILVGCAVALFAGRYGLFLYDRRRQAARRHVP